MPIEYKEPQIKKGNWKRILCWFIGHKKEHRYAAPSESWTCKRCGCDFFREGRYVGV
jgi:hypothetical protein